MLALSPMRAGFVGYISVTVAVGLAVSGCPSTERCTAGTMWSCSLSTDVGVSQNGYQACDSDGTWSECVSVGACTSSTGGPLPQYVRCASSSECGPTTCGTCSSYDGVQNPSAYSLCYPFCQVDTDCTPNSTATGVTPTCILGQCALLCTTASSCPHDTQCLPWNDPDAGAAYAGSTGLCE